jgi:Mitochondrial carrier protein
MQTATNASSGGILSALSPEFGGISSLFRGISAPLYTAALVNAIVFGSYGFSSRVYSSYYNNNNNNTLDQQQDTTIYNGNNNLHEHDDTIDDTIQTMVQTHDPWQKAMICGSFAGLVQCIVICPMEHVKCRLQTQSSCRTGSDYYKSPYDATKSIISKYGIQRLYQGWWTTCCREVPAFGLYFAAYDYLKDIANIYIARNMDVIQTNPNKVSCTEHSHTWLASAFAGGCAGCITWAIVYPIDVIKTVIQTSSLTTPYHELNMYRIGYNLYKLYGIQHLFRGLSVTLIRAFPVNGTIFPVYEFTLKFVCTFIDK